MTRYQLQTFEQSIKMYSLSYPKQERSPQSSLWCKDIFKIWYEIWLL